LTQIFVFRIVLLFQKTAHCRICRGVGIQEFCASKAIWKSIQRGIQDVGSFNETKLVDVFHQYPDMPWGDAIGTSSDDLLLDELITVFMDSAQGPSRTKAPRRDAKAIVRWITSLHITPLRTLDLRPEEAIRDFLVDVLLEDMDAATKFLAVFRAASHVRGLSSIVSNMNALVTTPLPKRDGGTLLHAAASAGAAKVLKFAFAVIDVIKGTKHQLSSTLTRTRSSSMNHDDPVNIADKSGRTALFPAVCGGHWNLCERLIQEGANVSHTAKLRTDVRSLWSRWADASSAKKSRGLVVPKTTDNDQNGYGSIYHQVFDSIYTDDDNIFNLPPADFAQRSQPDKYFGPHSLIGVPAARTRSGKVAYSLAFLSAQEVECWCGWAVADGVADSSLSDGSDPFFKSKAFRTMRLSNGMPYRFDHVPGHRVSFIEGDKVVCAADFTCEPPSFWFQLNGQKWTQVKQGMLSAPGLPSAGGTHVSISADAVKVPDRGRGPLAVRPVDRRTVGWATSLDFDCWLDSCLGAAQLTCWGWCAKGALRHRGAAKDIATQVQLDAAGELPDGTRELADDSVHESSSCAADINLNTSLDAISVSQYLGSIDNDRHSTSVYSYDLGDTIALELNLCKTDDKYKQTLSLLKNDNSLKVLDDFDASKYITGHQLGNSSAEIVLQELSNELEGLKSRPAQNQQEQMRQAEISKLVVRMLELRRQEETCHRDTFQFYWCVELYDAGDSVTVAAQNGKELVFTHAPDFVDLDGATATLRCAAGTSKAATALCGAHPMREGLHRANFTVTACKRRNIQVGLILCRQSTMVGLGIPDCCPLFSFQSSSVDDDQVPAETNATDKPQWHGSGWAKARKRRGAWEWLFKDRGDEADTPSASADAFLRQQHWFPLDEPQLANLLLHSQALKDQGRVAGSTAVLPTEEQRPTGECFSTWPNEASLSLVCADSGPPRDGHFTCTTSHSDLRQLISIHSTWVRCMPMADDSASKPAAAHKNTLPLQKRIEARETQRKGHFTYYPAAIVGGAGMLELDFNKDALLRGPDGELWGSVLDHPGDGAVIEAAATDELSTFTVALKLWAEHADDSLRGATSVARGQNMFHLAAAHNVCVGLLQACTRVGATPELMGQWLVTTDHNGLTPLRTAIRAQAADTMNALFTLAATATITWIENTEKLTTIVEFDGCLEAATGSTLPPLLHEAVQSANGDVVEALVTHCEISNADMANALAILRSMGEVAAGSRIEGLLRGGTPLHAAALCGELPEKRQRYEWHEKRQRYGDPHGVTPFFLACLAGHAATVRELFAWEGSVATTGAPLAESQPPWAPWSVNQTTLSLETMGAGTTPMDVAQTEIQLILRILDGDVLTPFPAKLADSATAGVPEGSLVLSVAVSLQRDDLVIQALHAKADPNQYSTTLDETPLMACVRCDEISMACLDALLEAGGDPTFETQAGDTIWSTSLAKIHDQAVACLLPTVGVAGPASQEFLWRRCQLSPGVAQPESAQEIGEFASSRLGEQPSQSMKQQKEEIDADLVTIKAEADAAMIDWQKRLDTLSFASASLDCLSQSALAELKALKSPPLVVRLVVSAVMVLKRSEPTWAEARKQLADPAFLEKLRNFDKDSVDTVMLDKLGEYTNKAEFEPERVRSASVAAGGLASWCIAVQRYAQSAIEYQPIKMRAQKAERALETKENALAALLSRLHAQWRHAEVLHGYARLQRAGQDGSMANDLHQVCQPLKDLTKQHWREMKCFATPPSWVNTAVTALSLLVSDCDMPETVDWAWNKTNTLARGYELLDTTFNDFDPARITVANLNRFRQLMAKSGGMKAEVEAEAALKAAEAEAAAAAEAEAAAAAAAAAQLESMKAISLFAGALWDFAMRFAKLLDDREACDASEKRFHQRQCVPAVARRAIVQQLLPVWTETINARDTVVARDIMTITAKDTNAEHMVLADTLQAVESMNAQHDSAQAVAHSSRVSTLAHALRQICAMLQCFHSILELLTTACHEIATATPTTLASWTDAYDTTALANVASELGSSLQLCLFRQHGAIVDQLINARTLVGDSCDDADQGEEWQAYLQSLAHDLEDALRTYATRVLHEAGWEHERGTELILRLDEVIGLTVAKFLDGHGH
jgi:ankyrin repeat protein